MFNADVGGFEQQHFYIYIHRQQAPLAFATLAFGIYLDSGDTGHANANLNVKFCNVTFYLTNAEGV